MPTFAEHFRGRIPDVSLEALIDGSLHQEIEYCIYAEIKDLDELKKRAVDKERHEQWTIPLNQDKVDGKIRLRLIDDIRPTMATKIKREHMTGSEEVESDISMDQFKHLRQMAVDGYVKERYFVPSNIAGLVWEVDVFFTNGGSMHPWVKIDLEVRSMNDPIPTFPIPVVKMIFADDDLTFAEKERIKSLWDKEWQKIDAGVPALKEDRLKAQ